MKNKEVLIAQDILNSFSGFNCLDIDIDDIQTLIRDRNVFYADVAEAEGSNKIEEAFSGLESIEASGDELRGLLIASGSITLKDTENIHNCLEKKYGENTDLVLCILDDSSLGHGRIRITVILCRKS